MDEVASHVKAKINGPDDGVFQSLPKKSHSKLKANFDARFSKSQNKEFKRREHISGIFPGPGNNAKITGIKVVIIHRFATILCALSSKLEIDVEVFQEYAEATRKLFVQLYGFFPLSPSVHRILVHGSTIIGNCEIPIGLLSEEAQERRNKSIQKFREHHSRKFSRLANTKDEPAKG